MCGGLLEWLGKWAWVEICYTGSVKGGGQVWLPEFSYSLRQHNTIEYLGCYLDSDLKEKSMARRVLKKIKGPTDD